MSDVSLALNCVVSDIANNGVVLVDNALDITFVIRGCTAFKLQGSSNAGSSYADIANSQTPLGASGTLTAGTPYMLSVIRATPFDRLKAVFSGTNPTVTVIRRWIRQSPKISLDKTLQYTLIQPVLGTP